MATLYARTAGGAWATIGTWSSTSSGGASSGTIPTASDDVIFDTGSTGVVTLDSATLDVCKTLTMQAAANKLTFTAGDKLFVSGNVTFFTGQGANLSGTGTLVIHAAGTLTCNGNTIPGALTYDQAANCAISGPAIVTGLVTVAAVVGLTYTTSEAMDTLTCNGGASATSNFASSNVKLIIGGGTLQSTATTYAFATDIDLAGNVTIGAILAVANSKTIKWVSGTIDASTNTSVLYIRSAYTLNTPSANMQWYAINFNVASTITLASSVTAASLVTVATATVINKTASETFTCNAGLTMTNACSGTATIILNGGTWSGAGGVNSPFNITGTVTLSGSVGYYGTAINLTGSTLSGAASTLTLGATCTLISGGVTIPGNFTVTNTVVNITLSGNAVVTGLVSLNSNGSINWTTNETLTCNGGLSIGSALVSGSAKLIVTAGILRSTANGNNAGNNIDLVGGGGTITVGTYFALLGSKTLTWVSGTIDTSTNLSKLYIWGSCTLNTPSANMHWYDIYCSASSTLTLTSGITLDGSLVVSSIVTLATSDITVSKNLTVNATITGTGRTITLSGNGTWSGTASANCNLTITGIYILSGALGFGGAAFNITGATLTNSAATMTVTSTTCSFTSGGVTFPSAFTFNASSPTYTFVGNWVNTGLITATLFATLNHTTTETMTCNGGITANGNILGTLDIILGGGTWNGGGGGVISTNLTITCATATITNAYFSSGGSKKLKYTAGTITVTGYLRLASTAILLDTGGMTWNNVEFTSGGAAAVTLSSNLNVAGYLNIINGQSLSFTGGYNVSVASMWFSQGTLATSITMQAGQTLTVTSALGLLPGLNVNAYIAFAIQSGTSFSPFYFNYTGTAANCLIVGIRFVDVDASGSTIRLDDWYGNSVIRCTNIALRTSANLNDLFGVMV